MMNDTNAFVVKGVEGGGGGGWTCLVIDWAILFLSTLIPANGLDCEKELRC